MSEQAILLPFFGTMLLTLVVWCYMYARRLPFILRNNLSPQQMTPSELARVSPPGVANPSDNLRNLFEVPTVFYAIVLYIYITQQTDSLHVLAAWLFFVFRVLHSAVHCSFNHVPSRFLLYVVSSLALWFMVLRAAWAAVYGPSV